MAIPELLRDAQRSLANEAYAAIRADIHRCVLAPGTLVTRSQLALAYGAGQAAVREALGRLAQEQLVQVLPRSGYVIAPITLKQVQDLCAARLLIEPPVARLAAGRIEDPAWFRETSRRARLGYRSGDIDSLRAFIEVNHTMHVAIAQASGNDRLTSIVAGLMDEMGRLMHASYLLYERRSRGEDGCSELTDSLIDGDGARAELLMREHISEAHRYIMEALLMSKTLQSVNLFGAKSIG